MAKDADIVLQVKDLSVSFFTGQGEAEAVRSVSFSVKRGEVLAIVGESGCGKSALCKSIMKLLPENAKIKQGSIAVFGTDITGYSEKQMQSLRGRQFSMVFQNPMSALNPTLTVGAQLAEAVRAHQPHMPKQAVRQNVRELMELVGIDSVRSVQYPHQFSGGMRQRIVLAAALAGKPGLLFADEPTTSLDVTVQEQILELFRSVQHRLQTATVFVSHDLGVVRQVADRVAVMYAGRLVEIGTAEEIYEHPAHPYTWGLLRALGACAGGRKRLYAIPGMPPALINPPRGDAFACRNEYALAIDYEEAPPMFELSETHAVASWLADERAPRLPVERDACGAFLPVRSKEKAREGVRAADFGEVLLDVRHLSYAFPISRRPSVFGKLSEAGGTPLQVLTDVSFQIRRGEIFGLVGESGCGKSTLARCLMNMNRPAEGGIFYRGINVCDKKAFRLNKRSICAGRQMIFQDSGSSLNPRMKVGDIVTEPLQILHRKPEHGSWKKDAAFLLRCVGMDAGYLDQYPAELSGGQRQRVAIARALAAEPELLIADEPVASLDVSVQAQIVNLFRQLQEEKGLTILFIAHDLSMVEFLCDRVGVMYRGRLVEDEKTQELFAHPKHAYTKRLLACHRKLRVTVQTGLNSDCWK